MVNGVSLGIPCWRADIKTEFLATLTANLILNQGIVKDAYIARDINIGNARNEIVKNTQMPYIFFVDPDTVLPINTIKKMLEHDLPIVSGIVYKRTAPHVPSIYNKNKDKWIPKLDYPSMGLIEVDAVGAACLLVKREVFEKIGEPYFEYIESIKSEDFDFCEKAKKAGYKIMVDCSIKCGHVTDEIIDENRFNMYKNNIKLEK